MGVARQTKDPEKSAVEFYQRLADLLAARGWSRSNYETPLEFAAAVGQQEVMVVTQVYNRVRFCGGGLSEKEQREIEQILRQLEAPAGDEALNL